GIPLSVKLILTTSLVVSGAVFASAFYSHTAINDLARADAQNRRAEGLAAIERESQLLARNVATAVAVPLGSGALSDVPPLLEGANRDYARIQWLLVVDTTGQVVAATSGAPVSRGRFSDGLTPLLEQASANVVERTGGGT